MPPPFLGFLVGFGFGLAGTVRTLQGFFGGAAPNEQSESRSDERVAGEIRSEWRRIGLMADWVDVTVLDGEAYLRGRAHAVTADALVATARRLPGVREIRDEVKR